MARLAKYRCPAPPGPRGTESLAAHLRKATCSAPFMARLRDPSVHDDAQQSSCSRWRARKGCSATYDFQTTQFSAAFFGEKILSFLSVVTTAASSLLRLECSLYGRAITATYAFCWRAMYRASPALSRSVLTEFKISVQFEDDGQESWLARVAGRAP